MQETNDIATDRKTINNTQLELICNWGADTKEQIWYQCELIYGDRRGYRERNQQSSK